MTMRSEPRPIAAVCVSGRSIYHHLPGVEAFDSRRDARSFSGGVPAIYHPPCRTWSKFLRHFAKPLDLRAEQDLARWCVAMVMKHGGVLEQPAGSLLWQDQKLPMPNQPASDPFCYSLYVEQGWFGYATRKPTWLLVCGVPRHQLAPLPFSLVEHRDTSGKSSAGRSRTMQSFAEWLCQTARSSWWSL
jgi:hypothetical protein